VGRKGGQEGWARNGEICFFRADTFYPWLGDQAPAIGSIQTSPGL
jgi:hypothetical protein